MNGNAIRLLWLIILFLTVLSIAGIAYQPQHAGDSEWTVTPVRTSTPRSTAPQRIASPVLPVPTPVLALSTLTMTLSTETPVAISSRATPSVGLIFTASPAGSPQAATATVVATIGETGAKRTAHDPSAGAVLLMAALSLIGIDIWARWQRRKRRGHKR